MVDLFKVATVIKDYGIIKTLEKISFVAWLVLPFFIWHNFYNYLGIEFFSFSIIVLLGLIMSVFLLALRSMMFFQTMSLSWKTMKNIETAKKIFENPQDTKSELEFRKDCKKFLSPYLHYKHFFFAGTSSFFRNFGFFGKIIMHLIQIVINIITSYSIFIFLLELCPFLNPILMRIEGITYFAWILPFFHDFSEIILQYPIISTVIVFLLSLPLVRLSAKMFKTPWVMVYEVVSILDRLAVVGGYILSIPMKIKKREMTLEYKPFTFPQSLPQIIQKSIAKAENKKSYVTKFAFEAKDEIAIKQIKNDIINHEQLPNPIRNYCRIADCNDVLRRIVDSKPVLYLGLIDDRCAFMGKAFYSVNEKVYYSKFYFDNKYLRNQFKDIAKIQIEDEKRLKQDCSIRLLEVLEKLSGEQKND